MFVTRSQIFVFIACFAFGGLSAIFLSLSAGIKFFLKNKVLKIVVDVIFCLPMCVMYPLFAHKLFFPNFRIYMMIGVFLGVLAYLKSFHILLAKFTKKIYNIIKEKKVKGKDGAKEANKRRKSKKVGHCWHSRCGASNSNFDNRNDISTNFNGGLQKAHRKL